MAKPNKGLIRKNITIHPSIKDEVVDFAKARSLEVVFSEMKNIAVITPKRIQFVVYKAQYSVDGDNKNFIHVTTLKDLEGIEWSDRVKLVTKYEMPKADEIDAELVKL